MEQCIKTGGNVSINNVIYHCDMFWIDECNALAFNYKGCSPVYPGSSLYGKAKSLTHIEVQSDKYFCKNDLIVVSIDNCIVVSTELYAQLLKYVKRLADIIQTRLD